MGWLFPDKINQWVRERAPGVESAMEVSLDEFISYALFTAESSNDSMNSAIVGASVGMQARRLLFPKAQKPLPVELQTPDFLLAPVVPNLIADNMSVIFVTGHLARVKMLFPKVSTDQLNLGAVEETAARMFPEYITSPGAQVGLSLAAGLTLLRARELSFNPDGRMHLKYFEEVEDNSELPKRAVV